MTDWITQLGELAAEAVSSVLVTVAGIRGSAPRETGAKMIVTARETFGSIGGGQLEHQCARIACQLLRSEVAQAEPSSRRFALGSGCGQCCGGVVDVMFEYLPASRAGWLERAGQLYRDRRPVIVATSAKQVPAKQIVAEAGGGEPLPVDVMTAATEMLAGTSPACMIGDYLLEPLRPPTFHIAVFGAGHVGTALVEVLSRLDCQVRWIDSRRGMFPRRLPPNVTAVETASPANEVAAMPAGACYTIMTHSHPLDFELCDQVLRRGDSTYCGLIGSESKRRRFERLMKQQGLSTSRLAHLTCPIGVPGISGKKPAEIALAVAAELLQRRDSVAEQHVAPMQREAG